MLNEDNLFFVASWDTAQFNDTEINQCCDALSDVMRALGKVENWDKTVGEVF